VDRIQAKRRVINHKKTTQQIVAIHLPALKRSSISLSVEVPDGIQMDSYPGPYGQVLTNLMLNALVHAFPDHRPGGIRLTARAIGSFQIEIEFKDDGVGMSAEVQHRAFEPFFTTRRNRAATGPG